MFGLVPAYKRHMTFRAAASPLLCAITAVLLTLALSAPVSALSVVPRSFDELVSLADLVIVGTVSAQRSAYDDPTQRRGISTYLTLSDIEVVKGALATDRYVLRIAGGEVDGRALVYSGLPSLRSGERYVLFIRGNNRDLFPVVGVNQGVYQVVRDGSGRDVVVRNAGSDHAAALATPAETLQGFLRRIRAKSAETPP